MSDCCQILAKQEKKLEMPSPRILCYNQCQHSQVVLDAYDSPLVLALEIDWKSSQYLHVWITSVYVYVWITSVYVYVLITSVYVYVWCMCAYLMWMCVHVCIVHVCKRRSQISENLISSHIFHIQFSLQDCQYLTALRLCMCGNPPPPQLQIYLNIKLFRGKCMLLF